MGEPGERCEPFGGAFSPPETYTREALQDADALCLEIRRAIVTAQRHGRRCLLFRAPEQTAAEERRAGQLAECVRALESAYLWAAAPRAGL